MRTKLVKDSALEDYPRQVFPDDMNPKGFMFGGKLVEMIDRIASIVAVRHSEKLCVTSAIDSLTFVRPVYEGEILNFKAAVNRIWNSSMEIGVKVYVTDPTNNIPPRHVVSAYLTIVAIDGAQRPTAIGISVIPETSDERRRFAEAQKRRDTRLKNRKKG